MVLKPPYGGFVYGSIVYMPYKDPEKRRQYNKLYCEKYYADNQEYFKKYNKKRYQLNQEYFKKNNEEITKKRKGNVEFLKKKKEIYLANEEIRIKARARATLRNNVVAGRIKKGMCQVCKSNKVEGHHPDHNKPLEVIWLCKTHHMEEERKNRML